MPSLVVDSSPSGTVTAFAGATAPSGWLLCDGSAISRTTYSGLFSAIGTAHGTGDGSTTFRLPDFRGRFLRGVDGGVAQNDPDRASRTASNTGGNTGDAVGSLQSDAIQGHGHRTYGTVLNVGASASYHVGIGSGATTATGLRASGAAAWSDNSAQEAVTFSTNGTPRTTSEARPKNINVNYIIKI